VIFRRAVAGKTRCLGVGRLTFLRMASRHRCHGRVRRVAGKAGVVRRLSIDLCVFCPGGHRRSFAADCGEKNENPKNRDDDRYKDQILSSHKS